jgi:hypothetical protein
MTVGVDGAASSFDLAPPVRRLKLLFSTQYLDRKEALKNNFMVSL